jgi:hypothetical protein
MDSEGVRPEQRDNLTLEEQAEEILRADAERLGLEYGEYCYIYGLIGPAARRRVRRHEVPIKEENA